MSVVNTLFAAGKTLKYSLSVRDINVTSVRYVRYNLKVWKGYFGRVLYSNIYKKRKEFYRKNVLKSLEEIPSLEERLKVLHAPDPVLDKKVNIGFAVPQEQRISVKDRLKWRQEIKSAKVQHSDPNKFVKLDIPSPTSINNIAEHYGIFKDLYQHGYFFPVVPLRIAYEHNEEHVNPVHFGNILQASYASKAPVVVKYESKPDDLWALVLTNLDGHLLDPNSEYLHWFIGNIKGNDLQSGEIVCDYLPPFPMRGTGYHRLVFVLYKQDQKIDFSKLKKEQPCLSLEERTFKTFDFYKDHQDFLTPAGLAFYQCTWDESLTDFFHNVLNMHEPVYEYIHPETHIAPQIKYPHLQPFNLYLDRYRDPKEVSKEVLLKRLKTLNPFEEEPPMPKYPCIHKPDHYQYSWQREDVRRERMRLGKYRDLRPHSVYPQEDNQFVPFHKT